MKKRGVERKEPSLFRQLAPKPLADRLRPQRLEDVVGQDHLLSADGPIVNGGLGPAHLDDPLGPAGLRKDDDRPPPRASDRSGVRAAFSGVFRRRGSPQGLPGRPAIAGDQPRDAVVHRRDSPLQPRAAGRIPTLRRGRHGRSGRRHHREPVLRAQPARCFPGAACWC